MLARRSFHCLLINEKMFNMKIRQVKLYESGETPKQQQSRPCDIKEGSRDWSFPMQATSVSDVSKPQRLKALLEETLGLGWENLRLFLALKLHSEASHRLRSSSLLKIAFFGWFAVLVAK